MEKLYIEGVKGESGRYEYFGKNDDILNLLKTVACIAESDEFVTYYGHRGLSEDLEEAVKIIGKEQKKYNKCKGRRMTHLVIWFNKKVASEEIAGEIASNIADYYGSYLQFVYGVHTDGEKWEIHFAFNRVSPETGLKYDARPKNLKARGNDVLQIVNGVLKEQGTDVQLEL